MNTTSTTTTIITIIIIIISIVIIIIIIIIIIIALILWSTLTLWHTATSTIDADIATWYDVISYRRYDCFHPPVSLETHDCM